MVLIAFNRPHLTRTTLDAIRAVEPRRLFLIADGPRADVEDDAERCAETRAVLEQIDWPCDVSRRYAECNLGLEANVELGLDWVFSEVDEAIILEDDCVAEPGFFEFAADLLEHYRSDRRVWQVSGSSLGVPESLFGGNSFAFTAWASVWGWATWADRWKQHRQVFTRDHVHDGGLPVRARPPVPAPGLLVTRSARTHFAEAATSTDTVTHGWDKHWWLTMMSEGVLAVSPSVNLVENVGWGADATHGVAPGRRDHPTGVMSFPLRHPAEVRLDTEVERELELVLNRVGGRGARFARRFVKSPTLRRAARTLVNSRAVASASRALSRASSRRFRA